MELYIHKNQKKLRCGVTTGTCCAAAVAAAARRLLSGEICQSIELTIPKGMKVKLPVQIVEETKEEVTCEVIKDSGDDPDVTNGTAIRVTVRYGKTESPCAFVSEKYKNIYLDGGAGVGRVTAPGLEQSVGYAAINPVPRQMIFESAGTVRNFSLDENVPLTIVVSVPEGEVLAEKTFNPRLGIKGGISILGTSGLIEPMSEKALIATIETEIAQKRKQGETSLVLVPGNYGLHYVEQLLPIDLKRTIKCSNFIGDALDLCVSYKIKQVLLVGNLGKLVKLAAGIMNTHSKMADGRMEILAVHTILSGGTKEMAEQIMESRTTEEVLSYLEEWNLLEPVMQRIIKKISHVVNKRTGESLKAGVILVSEQYGLLGKTKEAEEIIKKRKGENQ